MKFVPCDLGIVQRTVIRNRVISCVMDRNVRAWEFPYLTSLDTIMNQINRTLASSVNECI